MTEVMGTNWFGFQLDEECAECEGVGVVYSQARDASEKADLTEDAICVECDGKGVKLTDAGRVLMAFTRRHL